MSVTFEDAAVEAFRTGDIAYENLSDHSISDLAVMVAGKRVTVTWYPPFLFGEGSPRTVEIDGVPFPASIGPITRAAQKRARQLMTETMKSLDHLVA